MVKKMIALFIILTACSTYYARGQVYEYIVKNVDNIPSYFFTEKSNNFLSSDISICIVDYKGYGVSTNIFLIDSANPKDTIVVTTDTSGIGHLSRNKMTNVFFFVAPKGNILNGCEGWIKILDTKILTIVLGQQAFSTVNIKSKSALSTEDVDKIVKSLRNGELPPEDSGIMIDVAIEL